MNATITKSRPRDRLATEDALVSAAAAAFSKYGYEGTTTRGIAEAANCSEVLIQRYFNGKEGLLLAVLQKDLNPLKSKPFFERPLCESLKDEAYEMLLHIAGKFTIQSDRIRIVLSRVLLDRAFKDYFNSVCSRPDLKNYIMARLARYLDARMLDSTLDLSVAAEMILNLAFELGFMQREVLHVSKAEQKKLLDNFAELIGRALAFQGPQKQTTRARSLKPS